MAVMVRQPRTLQIRSPQDLPARKISEIDLVMCEGVRVRLYSADGQRSVDVHCAHLLEAANDCMILAEVCNLDLVALGDALDQAERMQQWNSKYALAYVGTRIADPYWRSMAQRVVRLAPDGSGTREALRYFLSTAKPQNVLY